jgi:hypothetical protein
VNDLVDAINALEASEQPPAAELACAPIIDDWEVRSIDDPLSASGEYNASGSRRGDIMVTAPIREIDVAMRWLRVGGGDLYRLGFANEPNAPIVRAAAMFSRSLAFKRIERDTGRHTLDINTRELLDHIAISIIAERSGAIRAGAEMFAVAMLDAGRPHVSRAWRLLAVDPADAIACGQIAEWLLGGSGGPLQTMIAGWCNLARSKTYGVDTTDPIMAAHKIGRLAGEESRLDPVRGETCVEEAYETLRELRVDNKDEPTEGVVVIPSIGGKDSKTGKELAEEFKAITGKRIPLRSAPAMVPARKALLAEFPYAERVIDVLLSDLEARDDVYFRPTVIVGSPGCGKSRFIRRLGEVLGVYVGRYDGAASEDNAIGGTARRWSTGEPCWPISVIRAAGHANAILHVDELDKSATGQKNGSTAHALLPMLENETARRYPDPFLQSDVDISHVSFLLTVNDDSMLPAPLKDRLRILRMPNMGPEHVSIVADSIVAEIAKDRGVDVGWYPWLNGDEIEIARRLLGDGSIRRLRAIVERLIAARDSRAPRH